MAAGDGPPPITPPWTKPYSEWTRMQLDAGLVDCEKFGWENRKDLEQHIRDEIENRNNQESDVKMDAEDKKAASAHASRAGKQAKHAARNGIKAIGDVAEPLVDDVVDGAEEAVETAKRVSPSTIGYITSETGQAFLGLTVTIAAATFATRRFKSAWEARKAVIR